MSLDAFTPRVRDWFTRAFDAPTPVQQQAWPLISAGEHVLISAPTGSGKTLAAFLWAIDRLHHEASDPATAGTKVVYLSPLKALGVDVERNLRSPLIGIGQSARRLGVPSPAVTVGVRSGDTTSSDRRKLVSDPPDILITTPESLYLMLTSRAG